MDYFWEDFSWLFKAAGVVALACWGVHAYNNTDAAKQLRAQSAAQDAADAEPHVIREADGCKVYAFRSDGNWHYFTRCPAQTTTDTTIVERHGKTTSTRVDSMVTENSK